jgi:hypothetical protein
MENSLAGLPGLIVGMMSVAAGAGVSVGEGGVEVKATSVSVTKGEAVIEGVGTLEAVALGELVTGTAVQAATPKTSRRAKAFFIHSLPGGWRGTLY